MMINYLNRQTNDGARDSNTYFGKSRAIHPWERIVNGHNFRMSNLLAGLGYVQMQKLDEMNEARRARAKYYNDLLTALDLPIETPSRHLKQSMYTRCTQSLLSLRVGMI